MRIDTRTLAALPPEVRVQVVEAQLQQKYDAEVAAKDAADAKAGGLAKLSAGGFMSTIVPPLMGPGVVVGVGSGLAAIYEKGRAFVLEGRSHQTKATLDALRSRHASQPQAS